MLVVLDTLRPDHLGCYGYERDTSPHFDQFAEEALIFENAQSAAPWTAPSLHSLLTSLYPDVHGIQSHPHPGRMSEDITTLAEVLQRAGFATAAFTEGGYARAQFGLDQGFDYFPENRAFQAFLDGKTLDPKRLENQIDASLEWLGQNFDQPFFLWFHTYRPHIPWDPPEETIRRFRPEFDAAKEQAELERVMAQWETKQELSSADWQVLHRHQLHTNLTTAPPPSDPEKFYAALQANGRVRETPDGPQRYPQETVDFAIDVYDASIRHTDQQIRRLWDFLDENGRREDTLVIFVSDHGEGLGQHDRMQHGKVLHEEALRVLFVMRVPGTLGRARRVPDLVRTVDIMPTVLELLGQDADGIPMQGRSLIPVLKGNAGSWPAFSQSLNKRGEERYWFSVRNEDWRLIHDAGRDSYQLYNLRKDPEELHNVATAEPQVVREMRAMLEDQRKLNLRLKSVIKGEVVWDELDDAARAELSQLGYIDPGDPKD